MKYSFFILSLFLTLFSIGAEAQSCNWKSRKPALNLIDSCRNTTYQIRGGISFNGTYSAKYKLVWNVNGSTLFSQSPVIVQTVSSNGNYNVCVKVIDTINNCDTTICTTVLVNCIRNCKWTARIKEFSVEDSCDNSFKGIKYFVKFKDSVSAHDLVYRWYLDSSFISGDTADLEPVSRNGTYNVCLNINDTLSKCDTTLCKSVQFDCYEVGLISISNGIQKLTAFPNPADNSTLFEWQTNEDKYELTDAQGRVLNSGNTSIGVNKIDLEGLSNGVYWLRVIGEKGTVVCKLNICR